MIFLKLSSSIRAANQRGLAVFIIQQYLLQHFVPTNIGLDAITRGDYIQTYNRFHQQIIQSRTIYIFLM